MTTDIALAHSPLAVFDSLQRGDSAPAWLVRSVIDAWGLDGTTTLVTLIAVSENATFRVAVDGVPAFVLRVHRPGHVQDPGEIEAELTWVRAIARDTSVAVPPAVPTRADELVLCLRDPWGTEWFCVAFAFVRGAVLEDVADTRPYYEQIGAMTARLHEHARTWERPVGFRRLSWTLQEMLGERSRWGDWRRAALDHGQRAILEAAEAAAREQLETLPQDATTWGLIHADLRPSNIMTDGSSLTVIDFDDCGDGWYLYDFAAAFSFIEHEPYATAIARAWIAGYRSVSPLSDSELRHAVALSMIRRLTMLGWTTTHREDALPEDIWSAQVPGSVEVASRYLQSPTWLIE